MALVEAAHDLDQPISIAPASAVTPTAVVLEDRLQSCRVAQASKAVDELVKAHGLTTPGDLMAALGVETLPRLLAMLGFTGDLAGLAGEVAVLGGAPSACG